GGTFTGGMVDNSVVPVDGKTLTEGSCFPFGGNIFGSSNSTVRIFGGVITKGTAYKGGGVYSGGKLTISGGEFSECVAVLGSTQNADNYGGSVYSEDTLSITGGTLIGGTAKRGGNVFANKNFTMTGGTLKGGVATDRGGNLTTMNGTLNITNCTISEGSAPRYGGNVYCAENLYFYNGSITNPVSGHNVTVMSNANAYIYGGSIYDGEFGSGIYAYDGSSAGAGNVYVYGGSVVSIASGNYGSNNIHIYNGFVGNITNLDGKTLTLEQMDANADGLPVVPECAHITIEGGYVVWHHFEGDCDKCGHTYGSAPCEACSATHQLPTGGTHTYEVNPDTGVAACIYCGLSLDGKVCAAIEGEYYSDLEEALSAGKAMGKTVKLIKDLEIENLNLYTTLDLAGYTLTVTGVLGAENKEATITDSVGTGGIIGKLFTHADNAQVPVLVDGVWKLERVALTQTIETISEDEQKLKFVITDGTEDTLLDEATVNGDEYKIRIQVQWTEAGQQKVHYFRYNAEMVKEYASAWGEKMYTCTITGLTGMEKVKITAQLVSGGVVVSAKDITPSTTTSVSRYESGDGYTAVSNILSWEKINSFPIKNDSMTVREMRELCVDYYNYSKTFNWVSNEDNNYEIGAGYGIGSYQQNNVYGGFAYVSLGTGNMYRFMDFMDERTGVVNINEANKYPTLFGNQCSQSAYYAWGRFVNSLKTSIYTLYMVEKNGYLPVGPYTYDTSIDEFSEEYGTGKIIEDNGEEVIYESYACLQLADGLVRKFPGGHTVMVCSDPVVVRDENGKIDPGKSYIIASDQTASWTTGTNAQGDSYAYTKNVKVKWTFSYMIEKGYLPFTFGEFLGTDPVEETVISYSHEGATISREQLFGSTVTANYEILDIYAVFTDAKGNEVCKIANRTQNPFTMVQSFDMDAQREGVPGFVRWGDLDSVPTDGSVTVEIIAQLTTGERPTLWEGAYVA
ncbi:MAG: hypothetical protein J6Q54_07275, partial [Oscillospiraceae bacterium]|nr:hypothetical protein [Oscillospiraceae bacterium]